MMNGRSSSSDEVDEGSAVLLRESWLVTKSEDYSLGSATLGCLDRALTEPSPRADLGH